MSESITKKEKAAGLLFASPWFIGFAVFLAYPLVASVYLSFCDFSVLKPAVWVGLDNYAEIAHDDLFWQSLANTVIFAALAIPLGLLVALGLAMLLNAKVKGQAFYRTIFFLPALVPQTSLACLWLWVFDSDHGVLNSLISHLGFHGPPWLTDTAWSKPSMVLIALWGTGNAMLIYLASLQDVPTALIEAAELDGASPWQKTLNVTIPMVSPVILFNLVLGIIGSLQVFTVPYIMFPNGAPAHSTYFYTMYLYDNAFRYHKMGYACAMGWIMFVIVLLLTLGSLKLSEKHVHYQGT